MEQLRREVERSLWLNRAVAAAIERNPGRALALALENLDRMEAVQGWGTNPWLPMWRQLVEQGDIAEILRVLGSRDEEAIELRQNSPFAGVLDYRERERTLEAFARNWKDAAKV